MSVVTLQMGQCGNQIGGQLFSTLMADLQTKGQFCSKAQDDDFKQVCLERFFHQRDTSARCTSGSTSWEARAVMVDMEPKVIAQSLADANKSGLWRYPEGQQFCQKRGSGNNWAHGYCVHGPRTCDSILALVRREAERCDRLGGFLTLMSLAGGTGSGLGTYMTQCLRDEFPEAFCVNQVVWPYRSGEVIVQNYNAVLTLAHLYQTTDALLAMDNGSLHRICSQLMAVKAVGFGDINRVIAHKLAGVLQPVYDSCDRGAWGSPVTNHIGDMLEHLVSHPEYKLLTLRNIPQVSDRSLQYSSFQWPGLLKHLRQMLVADAAMEEGINWQVKPGVNGEFNKSISNLLVLRGKDVQDCDVTQWKQRNLYTSWIPPGSELKTWSHPRAFSQYEKSAVLLSNSQSPVGALDAVVGKAWQMFASRGYIHQYLHHGMTEEGFVDCFAALEQVVASYKNL